MLSDPKFRELASLPLSAVVLQGLVKAGFSCVSEVSSLTADRLASICGLSMRGAYDAIRVIQRYHGLAGGSTEDGEFGLAGAQTALQLLQSHQKLMSDDIPIPNVVTTMCRSLDELLGGGGVPIGRITEVCGEPGVGKTQLCMQCALTVQLPQWFGGMAGEAVFIDTEGNFVPHRVQQMAEHLVNHYKRHITFDGGELNDLSECGSNCPTVDDFMSGIHYIRVSDHVQLLATCQRLNQFLINYPKVRLIVVDSIALPFRYDFDDIPQRNRLLGCLSQCLLSASIQQKAAVVLTNQITTRIDHSHNGLGSPNRVIPALGESWGHICSIRLFLTRSINGRRSARLIKHPGRAPGIGMYQVSPGGIRDIFE